MMRPAALLMTAGLLGLMACNPTERANGAALTRSDSSGVEIVEINDLSGGVVWKLSEQPQTRIGEAGSEVFRVVSATRLPSNLIAVANRGTSEVLLFDSAGQPVRSIGREGEGPGEFKSLTKVLSMSGDSVGAYDMLSRRLAVFLEGGTLERTVSLSPPDDTLQSLSLQGRFDEGPLLIAASPIFRPESADGLMRPPFVYMTYNGNGVSRDQITEGQGSETYVQAGGGRISMMTVPYAADTEIGVGSSVAIGDTKVPEIRLYSQDGTLLRIVRLPSRSYRVTTERMDSLIAEATEGMDRTQARSVESRLRDTPHPESSPEFGDLFVSGNDDLWIQDYDPRGDTESSWTILPASGLTFGRLTLPPRFRLLEVGADYILGVRRNDFDVELVEVYAFDASRES